MRYLHLVMLFALLTGGCRTINTWDRGYPRPGRELTEQEKLKYLNRFSIDEINYEWVAVLVDENGETVKKYYSRESVEPLFRHIAPGTNIEMQSADGSAA